MNQRKMRNKITDLAQENYLNDQPLLQIGQWNQILKIIRTDKNIKSESSIVAEE